MPHETLYLYQIFTNHNYNKIRDEKYTFVIINVYISLVIFYLHNFHFSFVEFSFKEFQDFLLGKHLQFSFYRYFINYE